MIDHTFSLSDRVAIVTGGGSGIGLGTAAALANAGARIVLIDNSRVQASTLARCGPLASAFIADVSDEAALDAAFAEIVA